MFTFWAAQDTHICLRCQLRLIKPRKPSAGAVTQNGNRLNRRPFSQRQKTFQELVRHSSVPFGEDLDIHDQGLLKRNRVANGQIGLRSEENGRAKSRIPSIKWRSPTLYSSEELGVNALGKPAEALVVRERNRYFKNLPTYTNSFDERLGSHQSLSSSQLLSNIDAERLVIDSRHVDQNINDLKDGWLSNLGTRATKPSERDCHLLRQTLLDGFTADQLHGYLHRQSSLNHVSLMDLRRPYKTTLLTRAPWRAGETDFPEVAADRLRAVNLTSVRQSFQIEATFDGGLTMGKSQKDSIVAHIVQQCWQIYTEEELDLPGELDISVSLEHLELIIYYGKEMLRRIGEECGARVDYSQSAHVLRVSGDYGTCQATFKLLLSIFDDINCSDITIERPGSMPVDFYSIFNESLLHRIGQLTNTVIRWSEETSTNPSQKQILVYHFKSGKQSLDDVRRLMFQSLKHVVPKYGRAVLVDDKRSGPYVQIPVETGSELSLVEREMKWTRLGGKSLLDRRSHHHEKAVSQDHTPVAAPSNLQRLMKQRVWRNLPDKQEIPHTHWNQSLRLKGSVVLGRLLYPSTLPFTEMPRYSHWIDSHHVLQTDIPSLSKCIMNVDRKMYLREKLRVRLHPMHETMLQDNTQQPPLPDLQLDLEVGSELSKPKLESARLIVEDKVVDVLLPKHTVDLRFNTQLSVFAQENIDPAISRFLEASNLNLSGGQRLRTPSDLSISIPKFAIHPKSIFQEAEDSHFATVYTFASIEHLSSITIPVQRGQRFELSYTTIEAGQAGGRRSEVRLTTNTEPSLSLEPQKTLAKGSAVDELYVQALELIKSLEPSTATLPLLDKNFRWNKKQANTPS
ncbi:MAG: hypothetical protein Q9167_004626 [Letrouitia subvulpina]